MKKKIEEAINTIDKLLNICKLEFDEMPESMETEMFEVELSSYKNYINTIKQYIIDQESKLDKIEEIEKNNESLPHRIASVIEKFKEE